MPTFSEVQTFRPTKNEGRHDRKHDHRVQGILAFMIR